MFFRTGSRRDWPIEDIPSRYRSRARIGGMLVNRSKPNSIVTKNDTFSAVAMMRIKVPNRDPFTANGEGMMRSDRNRVQMKKFRYSRLRNRLPPPSSGARSARYSKSDTPFSRAFAASFGKRPVFAWISCRFWEFRMVRSSSIQEGIESGSIGRTRLDSRPGNSRPRRLVDVRAEAKIVAVFIFRLCLCILCFVNFNFGTRL
jgi:hypothetical protein